ncbi:MAG: histidine kinase domain protein [uncultured archaeon A07HB70]|nr:MAG: histidine kinase domain protein [uncultured archaeon A07HB70]
MVHVSEETGTVGGWALDVATGEVVLTAGARRIYGVDRQRLTVGHWLALYHPAERSELRTTVDRAVETGAETTGSWRLRSSDGTYRRVDLEMTPVAADGEVTTVQGTVSDAAARERRDRQLRQYRDLLDSLDDAVFIIDQDRTVVDANERALANVDRTDETVGEPIMPLVEAYAADSADAAAFERALETALDDGATSPDPVEMTLAVDGARPVFDYRLSCVSTRSSAAADTPARAVAVVAREITDQAAQAAELRQLRDLFDEVERIADIGAWEYDPETDTPTNTAGARRVYGVDPEADLSLAEAFEFFHPEDRERLRDRFETCLETGEPYELDARLTRADGERRWVAACGERVQTADGHPVIRGYIQDITDEMERLDRLEQIETLFEHTQDMLFIVSHSDGSFVVERVNAAFEDATGLSTEDLQGKTPSEVFGDERGRETEETYRRCVETGDPLDYEETVSAAKLPARASPTDDGLTHWETRIAPVEADGGVDWIVGATRDVSERKRRVRALERTNERLDEFASIVSHDLHTPLSVAEGRLDLAREACENEHPQLDAVADAIDRSQALVDDLLTLVRSGETVEHAEPVSLANLAERCWDVTPTAEASLAVETDRTVAADAGQLRQLLANLFGNAVEHGGDDVTVTVGDLPDGDGFYVADDGSGIPETHRDRLFEAGHSTAEDGAGLGLRIVERIAAAHGWTVSATTSDAGGARFELTGADTAE